MTIGFFIWLFVAIAIASFCWWSVRLQMIQKKAWKAFSSKYELEFEENKFFEAPRMEGYFGDYYIKAYEGAETDFGGRQRSALFLELDLRHGLPITLLIMRRAEQAIFKQFDLPNRLKLEAGSWDKTNLVGTDNVELALTYLYEERLEALQKILSMSEMKPVFIATAERSYFILQHEKPITDPRMLNKIFKVLSDAAAEMEVDDFLDTGLEDFIEEETLENGEEAETESVEGDAITAESDAEES